MKYSFLAHLLFSPPSSIKEVAETFDISVNRASDTVRRMTERGLILREKRGKRFLLRPNMEKPFVREFLKLLALAENVPIENIDNFFEPQSRIDVVLRLESSPGTIRELQRETGYSRPTLYKAITHLADPKIDIIIIGSAKERVYSLNRDCALTRPYLNLLHILRIENKKQMSTMKFPLPSHDKVALYLAGSSRFFDREDIPSAITQPEIASAVGIERKHIGRGIGALMERGYVVEKTGHVKGKRHRRKVYLLTEKGEVYSRRLKENLQSTEVIVQGDDGSAQKMKVLDIERMLKGRIPLLKIARNIKKRGIIQLDKIDDMESIPKEKHQDFADKVPRIRHFFGRKRELEQMRLWVGSEEHRILVLRGLAGVGKTTLIAKFLYEQRGKVFWYQFYEWSTMRSILVYFSDFLAGLHKKQLKEYLRSKNTVELDEISYILESQLKDVEALLIFDDVHRIEDKKITQFLASFLSILAHSNGNVKAIVSGRNVPPFYDPRDVFVKGLVVEMELDGLDETSSDSLLGERGIDDAKFKDIYEWTRGHPLLLELVDSTPDMGRNVFRFIKQEIISKCSEEEKGFLEIASVFRRPFPINIFSTEVKEVDLEDLAEGLVEKCYLQYYSGLYHLHDLIREIFYDNLTHSKKKRGHRLAAQHYIQETDSLSAIEAQYHLIKMEEYEKAAMIALEKRESRIEHSYPEELMTVLRDYEEDNLPPPIWISILILKGDIHHILGNWEESLTYYKKAVEINNPLNDSEKEGILYLKIGLNALRRSRLDIARKNLQKALQLFVELNSITYLAQTYSALGWLAFRTSDWNKALSYYKESLKHHQLENNSIGMGKELMNVGIIYGDKGELEKATSYLLESLGILEEYDVKLEICRCYNSLGAVYFYDKRYSESIEAYTKSIEIAESVGAVRAIGYGLSNLGEVYAKASRLEEAIGHCDRAIEIFHSIGEKYMIAETYQHYGTIYGLMEEWDISIEYFDNSIKILEELKLLPALGRTHLECGVMYKRNKDEKKSNFHLKKALKIFEDLELEEWIKRTKDEMAPM